MSETSVYITNSEMADYVATTLSVWEATLREEFKPQPTPPTPTPTGGTISVPEITLLNQGEPMEAETCFTYNGWAGLFASFTGGAAPMSWNEHYPWKIHSVRWPDEPDFALRPAGYYFDAQGYNFQQWSGILNGNIGDVKFVPITSDFELAPDTYTWDSYETDFDSIRISTRDPSGYVPQQYTYPLLTANNETKTLEINRYAGIHVAGRTTVKGLALAARIGYGNITSTPYGHDVSIIGLIKFPEETTLLTSTYAMYDLKLTQKYPYSLFPEPFYSKLIEYGESLSV